MNDTVRFERKFILINKNISYLENLLRTSKFNFKEDYPSRKVNSIYFDDQNLTSVIDNLDGNNFKKKIRLRWYGDKKIIKSPTLEIKKKIGHVNYKKNYKMKGFKPLTFKSENINQLLNGFPVNYKILYAKRTRPTLVTVKDGYPRFVCPNIYMIY